MAAKTEPRNGIQHTWDLGENGWNTGMDANLLKIGLVGMHLSVLDKDLSTPPATPTDGASYLVGPTATDAWVGLEDQIVIYDDDISDWRAYVPRTGWLCFVEDEDVVYIYKVAGWESYSGGSVTDEHITIACSDETTALIVGTAKVTFRMPYAMILSEVRASVTIAPTGANLIVDINEGGVSVLSTRLSIDAGEKTSTTAATATVISDAALADDAEITIDIDQIGSTVAGAGLKVTLIGVQA
jgi:hypothetical protein